MSSLKVLPSQLSYDELLEAMEDAPEVTDEILEHTDDVVPFLSHYGVQPGETPVSKRLLYKLYRTYSSNPAPQTQFFFLVSEFVSTKRIGSQTFFCLNQDNFAISAAIFKNQKTIEKTKSITYQKHFQWFLKGRGVKSGHKWVEGFILFFIYKDYCKSHRVNPKLGYENFHKFLKLHFKFRRLRENRSLWFKVDQITHDIMSEEEKNVIRESRKKTRRGKKKVESNTEEIKTE
jgi:hypothetical protein